MATSQTFTSTRLTWSTQKSVADLLSKLDEALQRATFGNFEQLAVAAIGQAEFEAVVASKLGPFDFMLFGIRRYERFMEWYKLLDSTLPVMHAYTIGNPLIAAQIIKHCPTAGLNVPLTLIVVGDERGSTLAYDLPSSAILREGSPVELKEAVEVLDLKVEVLARFVTGNE